MKSQVVAMPPGVQFIGVQNKKSPIVVHVEWMIELGMNGELTMRCV